MRGKVGSLGSHCSVSCDTRLLGVDRSIGGLAMIHCKMQKCWSHQLGAALSFAGPNKKTWETETAPGSLLVENSEQWYDAWPRTLGIFREVVSDSFGGKAWRRPGKLDEREGGAVERTKRTAGSSTAANTSVDVCKHEEKKVEGLPTLAQCQTVNRGNWEARVEQPLSMFVLGLFVFPKNSTIQRNMYIYGQMIDDMQGRHWEEGFRPRLCVASNLWRQRWKTCLSQFARGFLGTRMGLSPRGCCW